MKTVLIIFTLWVQVCEGQTVNEWIRQKKVQKKYLLEQILELKLYRDLANKGCLLTDDGLKRISSEKKGSYSQDENYFSSLRMVSAQVKTFSKVAEIIAMHARIAKLISRSLDEVRNRLLQNEYGYMREVYAKVSKACVTNIDRLTEIVTSGSTSMTTDERIAAIDSLYDAAIDLQAFVQSFSNQAKLLGLQRLKETAEIKVSKQLNGIR